MSLPIYGKLRFYSFRRGVLRSQPANRRKLAGEMAYAKPAQGVCKHPNDRMGGPEAARTDKVTF